MNKNFLLLVVFCSFLVVSCRPSDGGVSESETTLLHVTSENLGYTTEEASLGRVSLYSGSEPSNPRKVVHLKNGVDLTVELVPDTQLVSQASLYSNTTKSATYNEGIKYNLLVFDANGHFVTEQVYVLGRENEIKPLKLSKGQSYTFVAYSKGIATDIPEVSFKNLANKTLETAEIVDVKGTDDLLYYKEMISIGGSEEVLRVRLRPISAQVTTRLEYYLDVTKASFLAFDKGKFELSEGKVNGTALREYSIAFPQTGTRTIESGPQKVYGLDGKFSLQIGSIKIGGDIYSNLEFKDLLYQPGRKYTLKISVSKDQYLIYKGQPAVQIGVYIWMRHNLGVSSKLKSDGVTPEIDPDNASLDELNGNYYQWGKKEAVGDKDRIFGIWDSNWRPADNSWNLGTEANPKKNTVNDPCPSGFRVPTRFELDESFVKRGLTETTFSNQRRAFISKGNNSIKVILPAAGSRSNAGGTLRYRGGNGLYWSTSEAASNAYYLYFYSSSVNCVR
ncbi:FimB/Mfa2 family fimbrial subunit [Elizabethkingia anophelis]|uniref:FimB/Mfa2 family fimbrial subunit n=1 Tax=Elizabethkingia anophelis TaxID=1117645 RepID=UPI00201215C5|nr:FimB/Mfa2 family fimbrial subunit [Elizabethkingia anophelis]MCL1689420.1 FimB/Mfa2 family fimbrial subunit [Elizabethkingia anophelis]